MALSRRAVVFALLTLLAPPALAHPGKHRHPHGVKRRIRRRRRVHRRRVRRRVGWRVVRGRRRLVVPVGLAVGWELVVDDRVVVVKEIEETRIIVEHEHGNSESIPFIREDDDQNTKDLEGSEYEVEIEEEVEEDD